MFDNTSALSNTQTARDFQKRTAARMLAEMAEEDRQAAARQADAAAERGREEDEAQRLKAAADAGAETAARRAASRVERLAAKAAEAAEAAARVSAAAAPGNEASAAANAGANEVGGGEVAQDGTTVLGRGGEGRQETLGAAGLRGTGSVGGHTHDAGGHFGG